MASHLILDTHVTLWLFTGDKALSLASRQIIRQTVQAHFLFIPAISIWEIAVLESRQRITLSMPLHSWIERLTSRPYVKIAPLSEDISIECCYLPGTFHADPADRMIVATSRILDIPLLTRDQRIIDYGKQQFVKVIPC